MLLTQSTMTWTTENLHWQTTLVMVELTKIQEASINFCSLYLVQSKKKFTIFSPSFHVAPFHSGPLSVDERNE